jgi:hypothetical protein
MSEAKDATNKPRGNGPARAGKKSHASPNDNQLKIDLRRHLIRPSAVIVFDYGSNPIGLQKDRRARRSFCFVQIIS